MGVVTAIIGAAALGTAAYGFIKSKKAEEQAARDAENAKNQLTTEQKKAMIEGPQADAGSLLDRRRLFDKGLAQGPAEQIQNTAPLREPGKWGNITLHNNKVGKI